MNDIIGGKIDGSCELVASVTAHVRGNPIKANVVGSKGRSGAVQNIPV